MQLFQISEPDENKKPDVVDQTPVLGIDLGTTNSIIALHKDGETKCFVDSISGSDLIPSVVAYGDDIKVGHGALDEIMKFSSIKRFMGKSVSDLESDCQYQHNNESERLEFFSSLGFKTPVEISSEILKYLKKLAESQIGSEVHKVVITVPAYFDERARAATRDAAEMAGLEVIRVINEPTAAAIAYGLENRDSGVYAVYDLGGGTFDVSILKMQEGVLQVLSTCGDTHLGGDDVDKLLLNLIEQKHGASYQNFGLSEVAEVKHYLSEHEHWSGEIFGVITKIDRAEFESAIKILVDRTIDIFKKAISDSGISKDEIDEVILVGGSTRLPIVKNSIERFYGKKALDSLDPDKTVAIGAAIQASNLQTSAGGLLLDVTPLSLKIEVADGLAETIIYRNSPIPIEKSMTFTTQRDGQTGYIVHVLQGEGEKVKDCRSLARFELKGIPPMKAGAARLSVSFRIDADGLLSVKAHEVSSGVAYEVLVKPSYGLQEDKIIKLLNLQ